MSTNLSERMQSADSDDRLRIVVTVTDVDRAAAKRAIDRENLTDAEYKRALEDEYDRRIESKTTDVATTLNEMESVSIGDLGDLYIEIRATPDALREIQALDRVAWVRLREPTTDSTTVGGDD